MQRGILKKPSPSSNSTARRVITSAVMAPPVPPGGAGPSEPPVLRRSARLAARQCPGVAAPSSSTLPLASRERTTSYLSATAMSTVHIGGTKPAVASASTSKQDSNNNQQITMTSLLGNPFAAPPPRPSPSQSILKNFAADTCAFCSIPLRPQEGVMINSCLHIFCRDCLQASIETQKDKVRIPCPIADEKQCGGYLENFEVEALVTPPVYQEYLKMKNVFSFKTDKCGGCGWCELADDNRKTFVCPICGETNCMPCGAIHTGMDCSSFKSFSDKGQHSKVKEIMDKEKKNGWGQLTNLMKGGGDAAILLKMEQTDLLLNTMTFECPICFMDDVGVGDGVILHECLHMFCKECLIHLVEYNDEPTVKCPYIDGNYSCVCFMQPREIKALVSNEIHEKHLQRSASMVDFLDGRLEDVWLARLFPLLGHNDLLRLRAVGSQTKGLATRYLWTPPTSRNRGSWELKITSSQDFQDVFEKNLPPPSEIYMFLQDREQSIFETEHVTEFVETYGKYITHLRITHLKIPFTEPNELEFYQGLTNLKSLTIEKVHTGGMVEFRERSRIQGSFLFPPRFRNLKTLQVDEADDITLMWRFINGMGENLETLTVPTFSSGYGVLRIPLPLEFLENHRKLKYLDLGKNIAHMHKLEWLRLFEICFQKEIKMKNVPCHALEIILLDPNTRQIDFTKVMDLVTGELVYRVDYQRNMFIGNVIHSLTNLRDYAFLMEMPNLEELSLLVEYSSFRIWRRHGYPSWPNLKKLKVTSYGIGRERGDDMMHFLLRQFERRNLEELTIDFGGQDRFMHLNLRNLGATCVNLKKLTLSNCGREDNFFVALWQALPLLESLNLISCGRLGDNGFIGRQVEVARPVFLNLQRLTHLKIEDVGDMQITDNLFKVVIRHMKLGSLELSSSSETGNGIRGITVDGIKTLLTGVFAESIQRLNLRQLKVRDVSAAEMKELESLFRSSQMI